MKDTSGRVSFRGSEASDFRPSADCALEAHFRHVAGEQGTKPKCERLHICTNILVFVEVKLRRGTGFGHPLEAVTPRKQAAIRSLAQRYLLHRRPSFDAIRFDVVGILVDEGTPTVVHVEDAF